MIILWFRDFLRKSKIFKSNLCNLVRYLCVNLAPELKGNIIQYAQYKKIESWPCFDTRKTFALKLLIQFTPLQLLQFCYFATQNEIIWLNMKYCSINFLPTRTATYINLPCKSYRDGPTSNSVVSFLLLSGKKSRTGSPEILTISSLPDLFKPEWTTKGKFSH